MTGKFSIITPIFNRADCLSRCIDSVINQDFTDWEQIIVDDGSTDASLSIANRYAEKDPRVRVFTFTQNRGTNAARNKAVRESAGDNIIILDSDDWLSAGALSYIAETMERNPGYRHYLFQADDLIGYYHNNPMLGSSTKELCFRDWLSRKVEGDFIHVIDRKIMLKFPFNEETRILEGVNFLRFYKKSDRQLYIAHVITHRDRGRNDSVTPTAYLSNKPAIERCYIANKLNLDYFTEDYLKYGLDELLLQKLRLTAILSVALSKYSDFDELSHKNQQVGKTWLKSLRNLHCGWLLRAMIIINTRLRK